MLSRHLAILTLLFLTIVSACSEKNIPMEDGRLKVLATTSIVADVVQQVGGENVQVTTLLPLGTDPHIFEPRPQDVASLADATLVFANGAGLEEFLQPMIESSGASDKLVEVSDGIDLLPFPGEGDHSGGDPHTWMDPNNIFIWVDNIVEALSTVDPDHSDSYRMNGSAYKSKLASLDEWIRSEVAHIPADNRKLVSDHAVFGYFSSEYGFIQVGTITGSFSTNASPSAREVAALEDAIRDLGVRAVFVGETVNQQLAEQVAVDTGVKLVQVYHASLTDENGPVPGYLEFMRYNVSAIVDGLK